MAKPELFNDLVDEILCRVPATNLKRLQCTSKRWRRLLKEDDGKFVREHGDKAAKEFLFLMLTKEDRISPISIRNLRGDVPPSVEVKRALSLPDPHFNNSREFDIAQVFHCDGLLLCTHDGNMLRYGSQIVVWNPFTGQARWIEARGYRFVLGYSREKKRKSYKILNYSRGTNDSEIYDFDSDSWRRVGHDIAPGWEFQYSSCRSVSFRGNIYWIAVYGQGTNLSPKPFHLLRFDFSTERSQRLPLPYQCCPDRAVASLSAVREDKLSVLLQFDLTSKTEIWVTNKIDDDSTKPISWTKLLALDLSIHLQLDDFGSFLLYEENKLVVWLQRWINLKDFDQSIDKIYIFGEDINLKVIDFGLDTYAEGFPVIFNYVPSFFQVERPQIKRAGGKRKRGE